MRPVFVLGLVSATALAAGGPENVLVVVNGDSWASTYLANEYGALRDIAPQHFVVLRDLPSFERATVDDFREKILRPAIDAAEKRGLGAQIDYLLYSADFPTAIDVSADMAGKTFPQQITQPAAISGLTFLYQFTLAKNPAYLGLNTNFYFRQVAPMAPGAPWPAAAQKQYSEATAVFQEIVARLEREIASAQGKEASKLSAEDQKRLQEVGATYRELKSAHPTHTEVTYNLACVYARLGDGDAAVAMLKEAMERGWWDMRHAQQDTDFRVVRERKDFQDLVNRARETKFELWPTSGFRGSVGWMPTGQPVPVIRGMRYLLSTMLGYTSGRGNSVSEALESMRRSVKADGTHPMGTIYFMENGDVRSDAREWAFTRATEKLRQVGVQAKVEHGVLPMNKSDVMGALMGVADFEWVKSGSTILPGAICEHFTSFGGMLHEGDTQTPLTEFIRYGAAGASGTVREPYAIQAKFPTAFVHYHYAQGCTLAEAFYQSVAGPYQLLIVGDALCAPWKKRLTVSASEFSDGMIVRGRLKLTPKVVSPDGLAASHFEVHLDGRRVAAARVGQDLEFDSTSIADGAHELELVAHATDALGSNARVKVLCVVRNGSSELEVEAKAEGEVRWDEPLRVTLRAKEAKELVLRQLGRDVGRISGAEGTINLDLRTLGQGAVKVQPVALVEGGKEVFGRVLSFRVVPPPVLAPVGLPPGKKSAEGFHVSAGNGGPKVVNKAEGKWLADAGVTVGGEFAVEGWFRVEADDVYQFQLRGLSTLRISVDEKEQNWPRGKAWWFVPVSLAKGLHRVRIEGKADGESDLDVRFGGPGSYRMDGVRFQHLEGE
jgi:tetratricopeptide (TPR) repeat protein